MKQVVRSVGGDVGFVERCREVRLRRVNVSAVMTKVVHSSHVRPRWPPHSGSVTVVGQVTRALALAACRTLALYW